MYESQNLYFVVSVMHVTSSEPYGTKLDTSCFSCFVQFSRLLVQSMELRKQQSGVTNVKYKLGL